MATGRVKPEPVDHTLTPLMPSKSNASGGSIKSEPSDAVHALKKADSSALLAGNLSSAESSTAMDNKTEAKPELGVGQPSQDKVDPKSDYTIYASAHDIPYSPEEALKEGSKMVKAIDANLKNVKLGSKMRQEVWRKELSTLKKQTSPTTLIAVCGETGAGKSSLLNAILDDNIVPTSGMRACTAVVTEIAYHSKPTIEADVSFLTETEWKEELGILIDDLVDEDGHLRRLTDLKSDAGIAWSKVHAVYPKLTAENLLRMKVDDVVAYDENVRKMLGATKTVSAKNSKAFATEINKYIDSKDRKSKKDKKKKADEETMMDKVRKAAGKEASRFSGGKTNVEDIEWWPLIRTVRVRCHSKALSTGAVLVDLPGVADANAARSSIARDYMKKCDCIWVLAPIQRAVDNQSAKNLLGDAFRMQLMMDGNYSSHIITFIASKCDDISCSEVKRALNLQDDDELIEIEDRLDEYAGETKEWKKKKALADDLVKGIEDELKHLRPLLKEYKEHLRCLKEGLPFEHKLTGKKAEAAAAAKQGKKRKNARGGKKGSSKRRRSGNDSDEDVEMESGDSMSDFIDDDDDDSDAESDVESNKDSEEDSDAEEKDSDAEDSDTDESNAKSSDMEDDDDDEVTEESLEAIIKEKSATLTEQRAKLTEARAQKKEAIDRLAKLKKAIDKTQRQKNAYCSKKRSEYSRGTLKEDFRLGMKDLDDAVAEERDPDNFDPTQNVRDYDAIDLPVFTASSRDYVRLKNIVKGDGDPSCFDNVEDTGIPALQDWCHKLTLSSRETATQRFFEHLRTFVATIETYVRGAAEVTPEDREALRELWESAKEPEYGSDSDEDMRGSSAAPDPFSFFLNINRGNLMSMSDDLPGRDAHRDADLGIKPRLSKEFQALVDQCVSDLKRIFRQGLEEKCTAGAINAADAALQTSDDVAATCHWQTYRATLRRHGEWRRDLNVELCNPFTRQIASSWGQMFESDLFAGLDGATSEKITKLVKEIESSAAPGLKERAKMQGDQCMEQAQVALTDAMEAVKVALQNEQKEVSRCLGPHVQEHLIPGYDLAMDERGRGSVARQKRVFHEYVKLKKEKMFHGAAALIMDRLDSAAEAVGDALEKKLNALAKQVETSMSALWEEVDENEDQQRARAAMMNVASNILKQVALWKEAARVKHEAERAEAMEVEDLLDMDAYMHDGTGGGN